MRESNLYNGNSTWGCSQVIPLVSYGSRSTLPTGNSWSCQQNNNNNAYYVTIPSANVNNNNKNNTYAVVPVAELDRLDDLLFDAERDCWENKKQRWDAAKFHYHLADMYVLEGKVRQHTYAPDVSICFVLNYPIYREVFAANYVDRVIHHLVSPFILQVTEAVHTSNGNISHGNRVGFSAQTAALQIQQNMREYSGGFVASMDVKGFFMNIVRSMSYDIFVDFCKQFTPTGYTHFEIDQMLELLYILINHDPTCNCIRNSPISAWLPIPSEKTLFNKIGRGLPIGNFYSQLIANLILAIWGMAIMKLGLDCKITQFVDDMCVVARDAQTIVKIHNESIKILADLGLTLHPKKFYIQPIRHGVKFCGRVIYADRIYVINRTVRACKNSIKNYLKECTLENAYKLQQSFNSYIGIMGHCYSYNIQLELSQMIMSSDYSQWLYFRKTKTMVICQIHERYKPKQMHMTELLELNLYQTTYEHNSKHCTF